MILDGWGEGRQDNSNVIFSQGAPYIESLRKNYPMSTLKACGEAVGLPEGQMGNSEVGHMNIGAGRIIYQDLTRITKEINDGTFFDNKALLAAIENCKKVKKIELPQGIKNISRKAFLGCSSLECVFVPISVTNIGELAFSGCTSLSDISYSGTKAQFDKITKEALWDIGLNGVNIHCTDGDIYIENDSEQ